MYMYIHIYTILQVLDDITLCNLDVMDNNDKSCGTLLNTISHCSTAFGMYIIKYTYMLYMYIHAVAAVHVHTCCTYMYMYYFMCTYSTQLCMYMYMNVCVYNINTFIFPYKVKDFLNNGYVLHCVILLLLTTDWMLLLILFIINH